MLPMDHVVVRGSASREREHEVVSSIGPDQIAVDIGPQTIEEYAGSHRRREDRHLERADGDFRDAAVR